MSRTLLIALVAVLIVLSGVGGYALAASRSDSVEDAVAAGNEAAAAEFAAAREEAAEQGEADGEREGARAGHNRGEALGIAEGSFAGRRAAKDAFRETLLTVGVRSETEREIGAVGAGSIGALEGSGDVLVVGDSLEVGTSPYLAKYLDEDVELEVNAVGGASSIGIFEQFQESYDPAQSVIVFDAGTNDDPAYPQILASQLERVSDIVGNRCMVVPTINDGTDARGKNQAVGSFVATRPGTQSPDWAGLVQDSPQIMSSDGIHALPEGYDRRAELIADAINTCLSFG